MFPSVSFVSDTRLPKRSILGATTTGIELMSDFHCPKCGYDFLASDFEIGIEEHSEEMDCVECGFTFFVDVELQVSYSVRCAEDHDFGPAKRVTGQWFSRVCRRCDYIHVEERETDEHSTND